MIEASSSGARACTTRTGTRARTTRAGTCTASTGAARSSAACTRATACSSATATAASGALCEGSADRASGQHGCNQHRKNFLSHLCSPLGYVRQSNEERQH